MPGPSSSPTTWSTRRSTPSSSSGPTVSGSGSPTGARRARVSRSPLRSTPWRAGATDRRSPQPAAPIAGGSDGPDSPAALGQPVRHRDVVDVDADHGLPQPSGDLGDDVGVVVERGRLDDRLGASGRVAGL